MIEHQIAALSHGFAELRRYYDVPRSMQNINFQVEGCREQSRKQSLSTPGLEGNERLRKGHTSDNNGRGRIDSSTNSFFNKDGHVSDILCVSSTSDNALNTAT